uniref:ACYPI009290 protein n=1 Tax=Acyrthosiphon pisum TaxID=7029 RepID=C4WY20_ACYPI|nr:ACYPI009290 [Acyrthosiphon pisum]
MNTSRAMDATGAEDAATNTMMETDINSVDNNKQDRVNNMSSLEPVKIEILWSIVLFFVFGHLSAIYGLYLMFTSTKLLTTFYGLCSWILSGLGVTAGLHRLWSHKSYKAKWPLRFILMLMSTIAFENHIYEWCMDHRIHHKYTDTNSDPHNAKRGFFFSHIGWLVVRRHPDYYDKCLKIDMSDLKNDPIVMFQKKFYVPLLLLFALSFPQ